MAVGITIDDDRPAAFPVRHTATDSSKRLLQLLQLYALTQVGPLFPARQTNTRDRCRPINTNRTTPINFTNCSSKTASRQLTVVISSTICFLLVFFRRPATGNRHAYRISVIFVVAMPADRNRTRDLGGTAGSQKST